MTFMQAVKTTTLKERLRTVLSSAYTFTNTSGILNEYQQWAWTQLEERKKTWQVHISITEELFPKIQLLCQNRKAFSKFGFD